MDTVYPEPLSQVYRRMDRRKGNSRLASRYRTLPVTFSEIQEVDEENLDDEEEAEGQKREIGERINNEGVVSSRSDHDLKSKFSNHPSLSERSRRNKPTLKSVNRKLLLDCNVNKPDINIIPGSPESPNDKSEQQKSISRMNLNMPRTSI
ncbi:uncharacterized protein LOC142332091 [Lycorma delicatula]|uniref:uncharacterized protein LOC142332091 n=1 Tax=Lycorma delicatula TaxID=130591 RepID=UPI003F51611B